MTPKEKLLLKRLELSNEYNTLKGNVNIYDLETFVLTRDFSIEAQRCTREELQRGIDSLQHSIDAEKKRIRVEEWFNTPAGSAYKQGIVFDLKKNESKCNLILTSTESKLKEMITSDLGEGWGVRYTPHSTTIGWLATGERKDEGFQFDFGNTFEILHYNLLQSDSITDYERFQFDMTFGTTGRFPIRPDEPRVKFVIGMGKFLTLDLDRYKRVLYDAGVDLKKLTDENYRLRNLLNNPEIPSE